MFTLINSDNKSSIINANRQAMREFTQCPVSHFTGTERHIWHKFCSSNHEELKQYIALLNKLNINYFETNERHLVDDIGVTHVMYELIGEDKVVLEERALTERIITILESLKNTDIDYIGWECSDRTGSSSADSSLDTPHLVDI